MAPWAKSVAAIPGLWYLNGDMVDTYFRYHHTRADTMSVLTAADVDVTAGVFAAIAWGVAERGV